MRERELAIDLAKRAGAAIRAYYGRNDLGTTEKDDGKGPLTLADLAANTILTEGVAAAFPDDGILSEETKDTPERLGKRRVWILDPLDGTKEFTLGVPEFVVSVGLAIDGEAVLGVLYNPATDELFDGVVGDGARYNGVPCRVTAQAALAGARFVVSATETKKGGFKAFEGACRLDPVGSVAYKLGLVAAGRAEGSFTPIPRSEWDLCGGVAIVVAAGGRASDASGRPYRFNQANTTMPGVCVTNGSVHDAVLALLAEVRA